MSDKDKFNLNLKNDYVITELGIIPMSGAYTNAKLLEDYKNFQLSHLTNEHLEYIAHRLTVS